MTSDFTEPSDTDIHAAPVSVQQYITDLEGENEGMRGHIAELEARQRWTPICNPPEKQGKYLVVMLKPGWSPWMTVSTYSIRRNGGTFTGLGANPSYWMELPEPPQAGGGDE